MNAEKIIAMTRRMELIVPEKEVDAAYDKLAHELDSRFRNLRPVLLAVLNGGLRLASELMRRCDFPMEIDTVRVTRYRNRIQGSQLEWHQVPLLPLKGRHLVLLDDVMDEGQTLAAVQTRFYDQSPASMCTLVLVQKSLAKPDQTKADLIGLSLPDRFLVGEGMDVAGYGRNLRGLWALRTEDEAQLA